MCRVLFLVIGLLVPLTLRAVEASPSPATTKAKSDVIRNRLTAELLILLNKFPTHDAKNTTVIPSTGNLVEYPTPITITTAPNDTSFSDTKYETLTCTASGVNLANIRPYDLAWYEQVDGGKNKMMISIHNGNSVAMHRNMTRKYYGSTVFCVLIFNRITQTHYAQLRGHYITILKPVKSKKSYTAIISSAITIGCLLVMLVIAGLLCRKKRRSTNPPNLSRELSVSSAVEAAYYSPIQTVPLYEAKAMAAANQKAKKVLPTSPPPLPARAHRSRKVDDENEYVYAYA